MRMARVFTLSNSPFSREIAHHHSNRAMAPFSIISQGGQLLGFRLNAQSNSRSHRPCMTIAPRSVGPFVRATRLSSQPGVNKRPVRTLAVLQDAPDVSILVKNEDDPSYTVIDVEGNRSAICRDSV